MKTKTVDLELKTKIDADSVRVFQLLSMQEEGGVEFGWYDYDSDNPYWDRPDPSRVSGSINILHDGTVWVPFTRDDEYWWCVVTPEGNVFLTKSDEYPIPDGVERWWSLEDQLKES